jgi:hypothetical protein
MSKTQTPAEIDAQIDALSYQLAREQSLLEHYEREVERGRSYYQDEANAKTTVVQELKAQLAPLQSEYQARRWERAFIAKSTDGHVHRTMSCSTCNNGRTPTIFAWVTEMSGKTEAEIIEYAGINACTICYPNAPVTPQMRKAAKAAEVAARKAEREAAKRAKDLAKADRAHSLAIKVDELLDTFGDNEHGDTGAYRATYMEDTPHGKRFVKGYDNAFHVYSDILRRR